MQPLDTPLWSFSLAVYGADGVAAECLDLQDRLDLDVNLLLFAAFAGAVGGVTLSAEDLAAATETVAPWHNDVVRTLREARRTLKPLAVDIEDPLRVAATSVRAQVKNAELNAEKIEQAMLWTWGERHFEGRPRGDRNDALAANLSAVLAFYRGDGRDQSSIVRLREAAARQVRKS
ncbi:MAG: TIGR02444 family protein [Pseudolabrys sp.]|jgi:uncharacterized protein (TIGR02444 family)